MQYVLSLKDYMQLHKECKNKLMPNHIKHKQTLGQTQNKTLRTNQTP